ncbi:MAG: GntR family transcriptional regulator [Lentisphaeria bacterium]|nr:MAG: GntR family transcriptional regulator [Lentisphaeria bacterium]
MNWSGRLWKAGSTAGARLTEEGLCREFGISRTPVREALRRLAEEGLIEALPRRGYQVCRPDPEAVEELFACRAMIEPLALKSAISRIPEAKLAGWKRRLEEAAPEERIPVALAADASLHSLITEYCTNRCLGEIAARLIRRTAPFRNLRSCSVAPGDEFDPVRERLDLLNFCSSATMNRLRRSWRSIFGAAVPS